MEVRRKPRIVEIVCMHSLLVLLCTIMLDGGLLFTSCVISLAAYWASVFVMACRVRFKFGEREVKYFNRAWLVIVPVGMWVVLFVHAKWLN